MLPLRPIKALHLASGDRWAGAEAQLYTLLSQFQKMPGILPVAVLLNEGELATRLSAKGIAVEILNEARMGPSSIFANLIRLLHKHRPDVIHTHRQKENILGAFANLLSVRARCIRTVHGAPEHQPQRLTQRVVSWLDHRCGAYLQQRIVAVSADLAIKLQKHFPPNHIVVVENGVDIEAVRSSIKATDFRQAMPKHCHIGIVGRLERVKRLDIFLGMAAALLSGHPERDWHFHIIGCGNLEPTLKKMAQELGITKAVTFHGERHDIPSCLAALDAVIICSDHEGLPMLALEAAAIGTPLLAHAVGGIPSLLQEDNVGILVNEHNINGYVSGLVELLDIQQSNPNKSDLGHFRLNYSSATNAERIANLYAALLAL